jgi:hypothetical protein
MLTANVGLGFQSSAIVVTVCAAMCELSLT